MNDPTMFEPRNVAPDTVSLISYLPVPGMGVLPINAFVIRAAEPVLVDTGLGGLRSELLDALESIVDPAELRWIWLSHADVDHTGNLEAVLDRAPQARVVTTFVGMAKLGLSGFPLERCYLLNPGQELDVGDRKLLAVTPPTFDAPETTGLFDAKQRTLFSADSFGALMSEPAESANAMGAGALREGMVAWASVDAPWLGMVGAAPFRASLDTIGRLDAATVLSSHLPAAEDLKDTLLDNLDAARGAPRFVGPDQAGLEEMMATSIAAA
ncbi:MAG TPA: MBL fold metallo-hydrolase [Gammaproteobacteria bacterium]|nr:MBL fold metallo-hydrolase [Gammaproteobacteria bacterium]